MVVTYNTQRTNPSLDQELCENALDLGLTGFEIIAPNERLILLGEVDTSRHKCILRSTVDERDSFKNTTDCEDRRRSNFRMIGFHTLEKVFSRIVDTRNDLGIPFRISGPNNDNFIQIMFCFERLDIIANMLDMRPLVIAGNQVIRTSRLIGGNESRIVNRRKWRVLRKSLGDLALDIVIQNFGASHCRCQIERTNIPSTQDEIVWMDHGDDFVDRSIDVVAVRIDAQFHGRRLCDTTIIIRLDQAVFGLEADLVAVGCDCSSQCTPIIASPSNHHKTTNIRNRHKTGHANPTVGTVVSVLNS